MTEVSSGTGINDSMALVAALFIIPVFAFVGFKLYTMLSEESEKEKAKEAKREAKKTRKGSSKKEKN